MKKIIQIISSDERLLALSEDGVVYEYCNYQLLGRNAKLLPPELFKKWGDKLFRLEGWLPLDAQHPADIRLIGQTQSQGAYSVLEASPEEILEFTRDLQNARKETF